MKPPSHYTPRYVAARVRKILAAQGWPMHKMTGRYQPFYNTQTGTEGYNVRRVGVGRSVAVSYSPSYPNGHLAHGVRTEKVRVACELLQGLGYRIDDRGWIECEFYD